MPAPPPGQWAPDPYRRHEVRYWNGLRWTEHVADGGVQGIDPLPEVRHAVQDRSEPPRSRAVPEATSLPFGAGRPDGTHPEGGRSTAGLRLSGRTHLLLGVLSCGLWLLAAPAVHLWKRGSRQLAGLWAAGATVVLVVAAAGAGSSSPAGSTAGTTQAGSAPSSAAGVRPLAAIPSSPAAQTASAVPTTRAPATTTPPPATSRAAKASPSSRPTSRTSTTSKPKPSTTRPKPPPTSTGATDYPNCTAMHVDYPHGVGRPGAHDKTSGTPVTTFTVSAALYAANSESDRDGDGIACEKA